MLALIFTAALGSFVIGDVIARIINNFLVNSMAVLAEKNWNLPLIKARSPNDKFWLVQYPYKDGVPRWAWYERAKKIT